jgi:transcriptional regulator with XRE-family HTH domain
MAQSFGTALREKRRARGMSQRELAQQAGLDFSYISKLENDRLPPPSGDTVLTLCRILTAEPEELLALTGKIPSAIQEKLSASPAAQGFLRAAERLDLSEEEWQELTKTIHRLRNPSP